MQDRHIKEIKYTSGFRWINIDKQGKKQVNWLRDNFKFDEVDLKDCLPPNQRPKVADYPNYVFMILQFPVYNQETGEVNASEIDFFISKDFLIVVHTEKLPTINQLFNKEKRQKHNSGNMSSVLYMVLHDLLHYCFPMLNHISQDIDSIESHIFKFDTKSVDTIREILRIKRNIVDFRKIMQAHKSIIQKLIRHSEEYLTTQKIEAYYSNLVSHTKDIWEFLENYKDTIDALHETHESLNSSRLNQIIKTLTIFSVIVFPLTLLAAIFGMNTMNSMPFVNSSHDFWYIVGIMLLGVTGMIFYFKHKKWL
ncbi:MAG: magnesium transporter CorA family protein [Patescibacteria group bacterium]